jgi:hypothetical protein
VPSKRKLKPPYYSLIATCHIHGEVVVLRKPNPKAGQPHPNGCGGVILPYPSSTVCPRENCGYHCKINSILYHGNAEATHGK